jgi:hypothetical protein
MNDLLGVELNPILEPAKQRVPPITPARAGKTSQQPDPFLQRIARMGGSAEEAETGRKAGALLSAGLGRSASAGRPGEAGEPPPV